MPDGQHINSFEGGMDKDTSKTQRKQNTYLHNENFRLHTDEGESSGALESVRGNDELIDIPSSTTIVDADGVNIPQQDDLIVIGRATIREDIYLFTTTQAGGPGQIWRLIYDKVDLAPTITRIYTNDGLNFSINNPIEAIGRYENTNIQRLYWTDNLNEVRSINVADPDVQDVSIDNVNILPINQFSEPRLKEISETGSLVSGTYQYSYRLIGASGELTAYSPTSRPINIVANSETDIFLNYQGSPPSTFTSKAIRIEIDNIDTDFQSIEIIAIFKKELTAEYTITLIEETNITGDTMEFVHDGGEEGTEPLTFAEFLISGSVGLARAKTMTAKDNRLFLGNIKEVEFTVDFDARAYRFPKSSDITSVNYVDGLSNPINYGDVIAQTSTIDDEDDLINPYNKDSTREDETQDQHKYRANSDKVNTLGGSGLNISYEFTQITTDLDGLDYPDTGFSLGFTAVSKQPGLQYVLNGNTYDMGGLWRNEKNPYFTNIFRGYQRSETYRFAIVFFSKQGKASEAKWIGDIRFPDHYDSDSVNNSYDIASLVGSNLSGTLLGIKFEVDISTIKNEISGYQIIRVERDEDNRSIVGQGTMNEIAKYSNSSKSTDFFYNLDRLAPVADTYGIFDHADVQQSNAVLSVPKNVVRLDIPQFRFQGDPNLSLSGYKLRPICFRENALSGATNGAGGHVINDPPTVEDDTKDHGVYTKLYSQVDLFNDNTTGDNIEFWKLGVDSAMSTFLADIFPLSDLDGSLASDTYYNAARPMEKALPFTVQFGSYGSPSILAKIDQSFISIYNNTSNRPITGVDPVPIFLEDEGSLGIKLMVNLYREFSQYGGNTFSDRTKNEYIKCGEFIPIDSTSLDDQVVDVWGGDTFVTLWDQIIHETNFGEFNQLSTFYEDDEIDDERRMTAFLYPVEMTVNSYMRNGCHFAINGAGSGTNCTSTNPINDVRRDTFAINSASSQDDKLRIYVSDPLNAQFSTEFDNRILGSLAKINGEDIDSWRIFLTSTTMELEGTYGPINKLETLRDEVFALQDHGISRINISPRATVITESGNETELGFGDVLHDYDYMSTKYGTKHQFSVINSHSSLYFYDVSQKKIMKFAAQQGVISLSDIGKVSSWVDHKLQGNIINIDTSLSRPIGDNPLLETGVSGTYDFRFNELLLTFQDKIPAQLSAGSGPDHTIFGVDISIFNEGETIEIIEGANRVEVTIKSLESTPSLDFLIVSNTGLSGALNIEIVKKFTLVFSEDIRAFTGFYSHFPSIYISDVNNIISPDPKNPNKLYIHNEGEYNTFYGVKHLLKLDDEINPHPTGIKVWDNLTYHMETLNSANHNISDVTWTRMRFHNDHQNTDYLNIDQTIFDGNLRRKEREWQLQIPRNAVLKTLTDGDIFAEENLDKTQKFKDRMRDKYLTANFEFDNQLNYRVIVHYLKTLFRISAR